MNYLRQGTAATVTIGPFLDKTDGVTEEVALAPTVQLNKNGGGFGAANDGTTAHDTNGWYDCDLDATDTNTVGRLKLIVHDSATHLPVWHEYMVLSQVAYDALVAGTDTFEVDVTASATADIADAVWDELLAGHLAAGSAGAALNAISSASVGSIEYTYTVDDGVNPVEGADVWITTDLAGTNVIWFGRTDAIGVAVTYPGGDKPFLDPNTYYFWVQKTGYTPDDYPDTEVVS